MVSPAHLISKNNPLPVPINSPPSENKPVSSVAEARADAIHNGILQENGKICDLYRPFNKELIDKKAIAANLKSVLTKPITIAGEETTLAKILIAQRDSPIRKNPITAFKLVGSKVIECLGLANIKIILGNKDISAFMDRHGLWNRFDFTANDTDIDVELENCDTDSIAEERKILAQIIGKIKHNLDSNLKERLARRDIGLSESYGEKNFTTFRYDNIDHSTGGFSESCLFTRSNIQITIVPGTLDETCDNLDVDIISEEDDYCEALLHFCLNIIGCKNPSKKDYRASLNYLSDLVKDRCCYDESILPIFLNTLLRHIHTIQSKEYLQTDKLTNALKNIVGAHHKEYFFGALIEASFAFEQLSKEHAPDVWQKFLTPEFYCSFWSEIIGPALFCFNSYVDHAEFWPSILSLYARLHENDIPFLSKTLEDTYEILINENEIGPATTFIQKIAFLADRNPQFVPLALTLLLKQNLPLDRFSTSLIPWIETLNGDPSIYLPLVASVFENLLKDNDSSSAVKMMGQLTQLAQTYKQFVPLVLTLLNDSRMPLAPCAKEWIPFLEGQLKTAKCDRQAILSFLTSQKVFLQITEEDQRASILRLISQVTDNKEDAKNRLTLLLEHASPTLVWDWHAHIYSDSAWNTFLKSCNNPGIIVDEQFRLMQRDLARGSLGAISERLTLLSTYTLSDKQLKKRETFLKSLSHAFVKNLQEDTVDALQRYSPFIPHLKEHIERVQNCIMELPLSSCVAALQQTSGLFTGLLIHRLLEIGTKEQASASKVFSTLQQTVQNQPKLLITAAEHLFPFLIGYVQNADCDPLSVVSFLTTRTVISRFTAGSEKKFITEILSSLANRLLLGKETFEIGARLNMLIEIYDEISVWDWMQKMQSAEVWEDFLALLKDENKLHHYLIHIAESYVKNNNLHAALTALARLEQAELPKKLVDRINQCYIDITKSFLKDFKEENPRFLPLFLQNLPRLYQHSSASMSLCYEAYLNRLENCNPKILPTAGFVSLFPFYTAITGYFLKDKYDELAKKRKSLKTTLYNFFLITQKTTTSTYAANDPIKASELLFSTTTQVSEALASHTIGQSDTTGWVWDNPERFMEAFTYATQHGRIAAAHHILRCLIEKKIPFSNTGEAILALIKTYPTGETKKEALQSMQRILCHAEARNCLGDKVWLDCVVAWLISNKNQISASDLCDAITTLYRRNRALIDNNTDLSVASAIADIMDDSSVESNLLYTLVKTLSSDVEQHSARIVKILRLLHKKALTLPGGMPNMLLTFLMSENKEQNSHFLHSLNVVYMQKVDQLADRNERIHFLHAIEILYIQGHSDLGNLWMQKLHDFYTLKTFLPIDVEIDLNINILRLAIQNGQTAIAQTIINRVQTQADKKQLIRLGHLQGKIAIMQAAQNDDALFFKHLNEGRYDFAHLEPLGAHRGLHPTAVETIRKLSHQLPPSRFLPYIQRSYHRLTREDWIAFWRRLQSENSLETIEAVFDCWSAEFSLAEMDPKMALAVFDALKECNSPLLDSFYAILPPFSTFLSSCSDEKSYLYRLFSHHLETQCRSIDEAGVKILLDQMGQLNLSVNHHFFAIKRLTRACIEAEELDGLKLCLVNLLKMATTLRTPQEKQNLEKQFHAFLNELFPLKKAASKEMSALIVQLLTIYRKFSTSSINSLTKAYDWLINVPEAFNLTEYAYGMLIEAYGKKEDPFLKHAFSETNRSATLALLNRILTLKKDLATLRNFLEYCHSRDYLNQRAFGTLYAEAMSAYLSEIRALPKGQAEKSIAALNLFIEKYPRYHKYSSSDAIEATKLLTSLVKNKSLEAFWQLGERLFHTIYTAKTKSERKEKSVPMPMLYSRHDDLLDLYRTPSDQVALYHKCRMTFLDELGKLCLYKFVDEEIQITISTMCLIALKDAHWALKYAPHHEIKVDNVLACIECFVFQHAPPSVHSDYVENIIDLFTKLKDTQEKKPLFQAYALFIGKIDSLFPKITEEEICTALAELATLSCKSYAYATPKFFETLKYYLYNEKRKFLNIEQLVPILNAVNDALEITVIGGNINSHRFQAILDFYCDIAENNQLKSQASEADLKRFASRLHVFITHVCINIATDVAIRSKNKYEMPFILLKLMNTIASQRLYESNPALFNRFLDIGSLCINAFSAYEILSKDDLDPTWQKMRQRIIYELRECFFAPFYNKNRFDPSMEEHKNGFLKLTQEMANQKITLSAVVLLVAKAAKRNPEILGAPEIFLRGFTVEQRRSVVAGFVKGFAIEDLLDPLLEKLKKGLEEENAQNISDILTLIQEIVSTASFEEKSRLQPELLTRSIACLFKCGKIPLATSFFLFFLKHNLLDKSSEEYHALSLDLANHAVQSQSETQSNFIEFVQSEVLSTEPHLDKKRSIVRRGIAPLIDQEDLREENLLPYIQQLFNRAWMQGDFTGINWALPLLKLITPTEQYQIIQEGLIIAFDTTNSDGIILLSQLFPTVEIPEATRRLTNFINSLESMSEEVQNDFLNSALYTAQLIWVTKLIFKENPEARKKFFDLLKQNDPSNAHRMQRYLYIWSLAISEQISELKGISWESAEPLFNQYTAILSSTDNGLPSVYEAIASSCNHICPPIPAVYLARWLLNHRAFQTILLCDEGVSARISEGVCEIIRKGDTNQHNEIEEQFSKIHKYHDVLTLSEVKIYSQLLEKAIEAIQSTSKSIAILWMFNLIEVSCSRKIRLQHSLEYIEVMLNEQFNCLMVNSLNSLSRADAITDSEYIEIMHSAMKIALDNRIWEHASYIVLNSFAIFNEEVYIKIILGIFDSNNKILFTSALKIIENEKITSPEIWAKAIKVATENPDLGPSLLLTLSVVDTCSESLRKNKKLRSQLWLQVTQLQDLDSLVSIPLIFSNEHALREIANSLTQVEASKFITLVYQLLLSKGGCEQIHLQHLFNIRPRITTKDDSIDQLDHSLFTKTFSLAEPLYLEFFKHLNMQINRGAHYQETLHFFIPAFLLRRLLQTSLQINNDDMTTALIQTGTKFLQRPPSEDTLNVASLLTSWPKQETRQIASKLLLRTLASKVSIPSFDKKLSMTLQVVLLQSEGSEENFLQLMDNPLFRSIIQRNDDDKQTIANSFIKMTISFYARTNNQKAFDAYMKKVLELFTPAGFKEASKIQPVPIGDDSNLTQCWKANPLLCIKILFISALLSREMITTTNKSTYIKKAFEIAQAAFKEHKNFPGYLYQIPIELMNATKFMEEHEAQLHFREFNAIFNKSIYNNYWKSQKVIAYFWDLYCADKPLNVDLSQNVKLKVLLKILNSLAEYPTWWNYEHANLILMKYSPELEFHNGEIEEIWQILGKMLLSLETTEKKKDPLVNNLVPLVENVIYKIHELTDSNEPLFPIASSLISKYSEEAEILQNSAMATKFLCAINPFFKSAGTKQFFSTRLNSLFDLIEKLQPVCIKSITNVNDVTLKLLQDYTDTITLKILRADFQCPQNLKERQIKILSDWIRLLAQHSDAGRHYAKAIFQSDTVSLCFLDNLKAWKKLKKDLEFNQLVTKLIELA